MTLKYLYLLSGVFDSPDRTDSFLQGIHHCKAWLHVPIDSYIMEALFPEVDLPPEKWIYGCYPSEIQFCKGLSDPVEQMG